MQVLRGFESLTLRPRFASTVYLHRENRAFGCGAFRNDPSAVARAAASILGDYRSVFKAIEFAVYCRPGDSANYDAFKSVRSGSFPCCRPGLPNSSLLSSPPKFAARA